MIHHAPRCVIMRAVLINPSSKRIWSISGNLSNASQSLRIGLLAGVLIASKQTRPCDTFRLEATNTLERSSVCEA